MIKSLAIFIFNILLVTHCQAAAITSPFGWRIHPINGGWSFHTGVDIAYDQGTLIPAFEDGIVEYAAEYGGYGNTVILKHENNRYTLFAHCSTLYVSYGQAVLKGQVIAAVGNTGYSTGPHLHLELWENGEYVDPIQLWR